MGTEHGTPKTLKEALKNAGADPDTYAHIKDFLAQKFCIAVFKATTPEEEKKLISLFKMVTEGGDES